MDVNGRTSIFREIHKNTWLKRINPRNKKSEKFWIVFCVHDDSAALLEAYLEPRTVPSHNPEWILSLQSTQHISHSLIASEQEYEFVITLTDEVVRFHANSWIIMHEWVDALQTKLREMKILSPKENLYTKLPEIRLPLLPTRDPTSPLPATPPVPAAVVPGVECIVPAVEALNTVSAVTANTIRPQSPVASTSRTVTDVDIHTVEMNENIAVTVPSTSTIHSSQASINISSLSKTNRSLTTSLSNPSNPFNTRLIETLNCDQKSDQCDEIIQVNGEEASVNFNNNAIVIHNEAAGREIKENREFVSKIICKDPSKQLSNCVPILPVKKSRADRLQAVPASDIPQNWISDNNNVTELKVEDNVLEPPQNITIIQVLDQLSPKHPIDVFKIDIGESVPAHKSHVQVIPFNILESNSSSLTLKGQSTTTSSKSTNLNVGSNQIEISTKTPTTTTTTEIPKSTNTINAAKNVYLSASSSGVTNISINNDSQQRRDKNYDHIFLNSSKPIPMNRKLLPAVGSNKMNNINPKVLPTRLQTDCINIEPSQSSHFDIENNAAVVGNTNNHRMNIPSTSDVIVNTENPSSTITENGKENLLPLPKVRPFLTRGVTEVVIARPSRIDKFKINVLKSNNNSPTSCLESAQRRRCSSTSETRLLSPESRNQRQQTTQNKSKAIVDIASQRMTLREQQVFALYREITHPGGIRLKLRRKDCCGSIACVDLLGAVWVAGWKQKEHPMLYNALHIGDQLVSIAGIAVSSANEANKIIRNATTVFVEVLIRRLPFGKVYAIRREREGQCLGLIRDGNTATIVDVVPNSLAARHGLSPKAQSCDRTTLTFWVLTEINGRPLNLFFRDNEIRDRLNSVGRDISILVQPLDLITELKKQLKSLRSHKDFIVQ